MENFVINKKRNSNKFKCFSTVMLFLFAILSFLDVVAVLVPYVLVAYGVMTFLSIVYISMYIHENKKMLNIDFPIACFLLFMFFTIISMIVNHGSMDRNAVAFFNLLQIPTIGICVLTLKEDIVHILKIMSKGIVLFSVVVLTFSYSIFIEYRSNGITANVNVLGSLLAVAMLCSIFTTCTEKKVIFKIFGFILFFLFVFGLYKTYSRTSQLSVLCSIFCLILFLIFTRCNNKTRNIIIIALCFSFILICLFIGPYLLISRNSDLSILSNRDILWNSAFKALKGHMLLGFGGNTQSMVAAFTEYGDEYSIHFAEVHLLHNIYIQVLVEYGLFTFIAFLLCVIYVAIKGFKQFLHGCNYDYDLVLLSSLIMMVFCLIHGLAESSLLYIGCIEQFLFILSVSIIYMKTSSRRA